MKGSSSLLLLLAAATACSTTGGGLPPIDRLIYWPTGRYHLEASVRYSQATADSENTVTEVYVAQLIVTPNGSLILTSSAGSCEAPLPAEARRDASRGRKSLVCGNVTYYLWPEDGRMDGEIVASVQEQTRELLPCQRYRTGLNGRDRCAGYRWAIESRTVEKRARLRVVAGS